jgi:hypothetical protein
VVVQSVPPASGNKMLRAAVGAVKPTVVELVLAALFIMMVLVAAKPWIETDVPVAVAAL